MKWNSILKALKNYVDRNLIDVLTFLALLTGTVYMCSCSRVQYVEIEKESRDTLYTERVLIDSVYMKDSVFVNRFVSGDTVFVEKTKIKDKWHYVLRKDTVSNVVYERIEVPVTVERKLSRWQALKLKLGGYAFFIGFILIGLFVCLIIRFRK